MSILSEISRIIKAPFSVDNYYKALNYSLKRVNNEYTMLHYPFFVNSTDSFLQSQKNLTDQCITYLGQIKDCSLLEIGCGNGIQLIYLHCRYFTSEAMGIDLNQANIDIANEEKRRLKLENISFSVNNSQELTGIKNDLFDFVVCIESAFHYPDKQAFLSELSRVLKPGGRFLIADLLSNNKNPSTLMSYFRKKLHLHHWNKYRYLKGFNDSGLEVLNSVDITAQVIRGFENYPNWLPKIKGRNFISGISHMFFYRIILFLFIYLLKKRRIYEIFIGRK